MGRTLLSSTQLVAKEKNMWRDYRRALRAEDKVHFDRMFSYAKKHAAAIANSGSPYPFEAILISIILELMRELDKTKNGTARDNESLFD